jgi:hypothetical protein
LEKLNLEPKKKVYPKKKEDFTASNPIIQKSKNSNWAQIVKGPEAEEEKVVSPKKSAKTKFKRDPSPVREVEILAEPVVSPIKSVELSPSPKYITSPLQKQSTPFLQYSSPPIEQEIVSPVQNLPPGLNKRNSRPKEKAVMTTLASGGVQFGSFGTKKDIVSPEKDETSTAIFNNSQREPPSVAPGLQAYYQQIPAVPEANYYNDHRSMVLFV